MLNFDEIAERKLTKMKRQIEGKTCAVSLDSCSSASIVSESFLVDYLNKDLSMAHGPFGSVKGIGETIT